MNEIRTIGEKKTSLYQDYQSSGTNAHIMNIHSKKYQVDDN